MWTHWLQGSPVLRADHGPGLVCSRSVLHHSRVLHALNVLRLPVPRLVAVDTGEGELEAITKVTLHGFALFLECMCRAVIYQSNSLGRVVRTCWFLHPGMVIQVSA